MHPAFHEGLAGSPLRLRNLILMVRENKIDTADMKVKCLAQRVHRHRRAFDVPPWSPIPELAGPGRLSVPGCLPEREVPRVLFRVLVLIQPFTCSRNVPVEVDLRKLAVSREGS